VKEIFISHDKHQEDNLLGILRSYGMAPAAPCGGKGICGKCRVRILKGDTTLCAPYDENQVITREEWDNGYRLACRTRVVEDLVIEVPDSHNANANIMTDCFSDTHLKPVIFKKYIELSKPSLIDQASDVDRIEREAGGAVVRDIDLVRKLPDILKNNDYKVTCVIAADEIIAVEGGDTSGACYGVAVDIGTTTIVGMLIDLNTGAEVAIYSCLNPQKQYGDDVISRIDYTRSYPDGLSKLNSLIINQLNDMLGFFCSKYDIPPACIYHMNLVGNTVMIHILSAVSVDSIAISPFNPVFTRFVGARGKDFGLDMCPEGLVTVLPTPAGYIGADTIACLSACGMAAQPGQALMIDIGTNGEIALGNRENIVACAAAAGPAFEGGHIECGVGGIAGAINKVRLDKSHVSYTTIDDAPAMGICGSGLVDAIAGMLKLGLIDSTGKIITRQEARERFSIDIVSRLRECSGKPCFLIAAKEAGAQRNIYIAQKDIREVQLAKAAIMAGIKVLLHECKADYDDIETVYLAGGFGNYIDMDSATAIGLIPVELRDKIVPIGNGALTGAKLSLKSSDQMAEAGRIYKLIRYVELSSRPDFQDLFVDCMELV